MTFHAQYIPVDPNLVVSQVMERLPEITMISIVSVIVVFGAFTILGWKILNMIANWGKKGTNKEWNALVQENKGLRDRIENLESLVCRMDQEINTQLEKSLWMLHRSNPGSVSQQMTAMVNITSALESRYQVLRELGRGGMGIVFEAYDKQLKENVAIKVLSPFLSHDDEALERLRREVTTARKITHPNVIKIYDIAEAGGLHYITMEYFEGENLRQYISRKGAISLAEGLQILYQICDGLEAAHSQGVIHRDLKSQNVILNNRGQLKIIDLGLARTTHLEGMTATGLIMGTPEYMSPEQVMGKRIDERSDLYSLGIIAYEVFSGKVPFRGESPIAVGYLHLKENYTPLSEVVPNAPEQLGRIVERLLQKDPAHRYQSIQEVRRDLQELQSYRPIVQQQTASTQSVALKE